LCDHLFINKDDIRAHLQSVHDDLYEQLKKSADDEVNRRKHPGKRKRKTKEPSASEGDESENGSEDEWTDQDDVKSQPTVQTRRSTRARKPTAKASQAKDVSGAQADDGDDKLKSEVRVVLKRLTEEQIEYHTTKITYLHQ